MSASAHSNEHYEILLRNVSLALGDAVLQLIKNHKKGLRRQYSFAAGDRDRARAGSAAVAALRSAIELVGLAPKG